MTPTLHLACHASLVANEVRCARFGKQVEVLRVEEAGEAHGADEGVGRELGVEEALVGVGVGRVTGGSGVYEDSRAGGAFALGGEGGEVED